MFKPGFTDLHIEVGMEVLEKTTEIESAEDKLEASKTQAFLNGWRQAESFLRDLKGQLDKQMRDPKCSN
jgi:hypothetical protein